MPYKVTFREYCRLLWAHGIGVPFCISNRSLQLKRAAYCGIFLPVSKLECKNCMYFSKQILMEVSNGRFNRLRVQFKNDA